MGNDKIICQKNTENTMPNCFPVGDRDPSVRSRLLQWILNVETLKIKISNIYRLFDRQYTSN